MKRILLSSLSLILIGTVIGQSYQPLVVENRNWVYHYRVQIDGGCNLYFINGADVQYFKGDTTIGSHSYKKFLSSSLRLRDNMGGPVQPYSITNTEVIGYFREDSIAKKVFAISDHYLIDHCSEDDSEFLLFDFSLNVGDSINHCLGTIIGAGVFDTTYSKIDSIVNVDFEGKNRRLFYTIGAFAPCGLVVPRVGGILEGFGFIGGPLPDTYNRELIEYCEGTLEQCNIVANFDCPNGDIACLGGSDACDLCNDNDILDLRSLIVDPTLFTPGGKWTVRGPNSAIIPLTGTILDAKNLPAGSYNIRYDILPVPSDTCPKFDEVLIKIRKRGFAAITADTLLCNGPDGTNEFNIASLNTSSSIGIWRDANGDPVIIPFIVNIADIPAGGTAKYTFTVENQMPCSNSVYPVLLNITDDCTSVGLEKEATFFNILNVYPNPSSGFLEIDISDLNLKTQIIMTNILGLKVYVTDKLKEGHNILDLSNLNSGTYLYKIIQEDKVITSGKWLKF